MLPLIVSEDSTLKLVIHFFRGTSKTEEVPGTAIALWAWLADLVIGLHQANENEPTSQESIKKMFAQVVNMGLLDYNDCDKLFEYARHPELQEESQRPSSHLWPYGTLEQTTFPARGRMSPLLQYPTYSQTRMGYEDEQEVAAFLNYIHEDPNRPLLEATHGNLHLLRFLRLPKLPSEAFCYYLSDEWAQEQVGRLLHLLNTRATQINPVSVPLLLRAAVLESVMLF
jgi:hypothetical protein